MEKMNIRLQRQVNLLIKRYPILESVEQNIIDAYLVMQESYENGGKLLIAGNGGSAADSEHIVGELMKGFKLPRKTNDKYETVILIHTDTTDNMLMEIMQKLSIFDLHVDRFLTIHEKLGIAYEVTIYVKDLTYLQKVVTELEKLSYVSKIERLSR